MEKRAVLAVVLSLLVLMGYQLMFAPVPPEVPTEQPAIAPDGKENAQPVQAQDNAQTEKQAAVVFDGMPGRDIVVETGKLRVLLNTRGAVVKSWQLKDYKDNVESGTSVDIIPTQKEVLALVKMENGTFIPESLHYAADRESLNSAGSVVFSTVRPDGIKVNKTYTFSENDYKAKLSVSYENTATVNITERPAFSLVMSSKKEDRAVMYHELAYISGKEVKRVYPDDFKNDKFGSGEMEWVFLGDKYFMTAVVLPKSSASELYSLKVSDEIYSAYLFSRLIEIKPGETKGDDFELYFGPKDVDFLKEAGSRLERTIDLGFFDLVAYPMLLSLKWMYQIVPNYGWVIIIFTVIIKILFFPLSQKSYKSMKEMQQIAPLMEQLREKYKNDKERLNREIMELYRLHKVNPLGGCLPMLIQIPVFFALYTVLNGAVELRHAPFILWITDLSAKDPYYVTPIVMGATMFIQQKMTPSGGDPMQQKVMMMMPVIFTAISLNFSSGLVLYWLINNVLSIGQQYYVNKFIR